MVYDVVIISLNYSQIFYIIIACGIMFYFLLGLALYYLLTRYNMAPPKWVYYVFISIVIATLLGIIIAAFFINFMSIMATFSVAMLIPISLVVIFGWSQFYYRYHQRFDNVVVYSAYGLPAYRFVSEKEAMKKD